MCSLQLIRLSSRGLSHGQCVMEAGKLMPPGEGDSGGFGAPGKISPHHGPEAGEALGAPVGAPNFSSLGATAAEGWME